MHGLCLSFPSLSAALAFLVSFVYLSVYVSSRYFPQVCACEHLRVCMCLCGRLCMKYVCVSACACISVLVSVLLTHSLRLARTQIVEDGERASGRSPGPVPFWPRIGEGFGKVSTLPVPVAGAWLPEHLTVISQPLSFLVHELPQAGPSLFPGKIQSWILPNSTLHEDTVMGGAPSLLLRLDLVFN